MDTSSRLPVRLASFCASCSCCREISFSRTRSSPSRLIPAPLERTGFQQFIGLSKNLQRTIADPMVKHGLPRSKRAGTYPQRAAQSPDVAAHPCLLYTSDAADER